MFDKCKKYIILLLEKMKRNVIFFVTHQKFLQSNKKITLITETGNPEELSYLRDNLQEYVLLAAATSKSHNVDTSLLLSKIDLTVLNELCYNQVKKMEVITMEQLVQFIVWDMVQGLGKIKRVNHSPGIPTGQKNCLQVSCYVFN